MLKRFSVALAALFVLATSAFGAGTVPGFNLVPQFDKLGKVAPGCKLYVVQAGTVSTPQNPYQDSGLTLLQTNPIRCDSSGRLPQWFVADGAIKLRLTTSTGTEIFAQDNLLVIGASSGGGGGSPVDPTTVLSTGDLKATYGTGILSGFVRANGRTIGSATSGASERANTDCQPLFEYLWNADASLVVSTGRGASANADWVANKTIALPDLRGRTLAGLDDMGNSSANRLTASYFGANGTVLGNSGGSESRTLFPTNLPSYTPAGTFAGTGATITSTLSGTVTVTSADVMASHPSLGFAQYSSASLTANNGPATSGALVIGTKQSSGPLSTGAGSASYTPAGTFTGTVNGGASTPFAITTPTIVITYYQKL